jgi:hypothetical protein
MESTQTIEYPIWNINQDEWMESLEKTGVAVISQALSKAEKDEALAKFKSFVVNLDSGLDIEDQTTCTEERWPFRNQGYTGYGTSSSEVAWYLRTRPAVINAFARIWGVEKTDLLSSLDLFICYRQWWLSGEEDWSPHSAGLHCDQNPWDKPGKHCI